MTKSKGVAIIIDADIARAAGGKDAVHPTPINCRNFLQTFLKTPHYLAMSPAIREEWEKHESSFTRRWRVSMVARKKFTYVQPESNLDLTEMATSCLVDWSQKKALLKDFHLVLTALACDRRISSMDETVRGLLAVCTKQVIEIRDITWVNPDKTDEQPIDWLKAGAPAEKERLLGQWTG
jgi:hypothetical protein